MKSKRKKYSPEEKMVILKKHLLEKVLWFTVKWNFQTSKLVTKLIILYSFC
jgi:hypothetical protein